MEVGAARRGLATGPSLWGWAAGRGAVDAGSRGICWGIFRLRGWSGIADWLGAGEAGHARITRETGSWARSCGRGCVPDCGQAVSLEGRPDLIACYTLEARVDCIEI